MISFAPLEPDAVAFLVERTGLDAFAREPSWEEPKWFCATSRDDRNDKIDGVFIAEFTSWFEAHLTTAVDNPAIVTRHLLRVLFSTIFSRAVRCTAYAEPENKRSIDGLERLGFVREGFMRFIIDGRRDAFVYGMVIPECRWLARPHRRVFKEAAE